MSYRSRLYACAVALLAVAMLVVTFGGTAHAEKAPDTEIPSAVVFDSPEHYVKSLGDVCYELWLNNSAITPTPIDGVEFWQIGYPDFADTGVRVTGTPASDVIIGSTGADSIWGDDGDDVICGGPGRDNLNGGGGNDWVHGHGGHDSLVGTAGFDILLGGSGGDRLWGGDGPDFMCGGSGTDSYHGATPVNPDSDLDRGFDTDGDSVVMAVDDFLDEPCPDDLGSEEGPPGRPNVGEAGEVLEGTPQGGQTDDAAAEEAYVRSLGDLCFEAWSEGDNVIVGAEHEGLNYWEEGYHGYPLPRDGDEEVIWVGGASKKIDRVFIGSTGPDRYVGGNGDDIICGGPDNDKLTGLQGDDLIIGGSGTDTLSGNAGGDDLDGGNDTDFLDGGTGKDRLCGGDDGLADKLDGGPHSPKDELYEADGGPETRGNPLSGHCPFNR